VAAPPQALTPDPGIYAIGFHLPQRTVMQVGALGRWDFPSGSYIYVGSAWGPGGLSARIRRHWRTEKTLRWHIDYLRAYASPVALWLAPGSHDECGWAQHLLALPDARVVVPGFGASDCPCQSHMAYVGTAPLHKLSFPGGRRLSWKG
jgi:Uri superfamily endonuclease